MIRKAVIVACLLLALATIVVGAISYRTEIICWGRDRGSGAEWTRVGNPMFATMDDVARLTFGARASFVRGSICLLWTAGPTGQTTPGTRTTNGVLFRWRRSDMVLLRESGPYALVIALRANCVHQLTVPLWGPLALLLAYPLLAFIRGPVRRHRRRKKGLCLKCGYNLTGNVSGVCPECGAPI